MSTKGGNTKKGMSQTPKGTQHEPPAVRARKLSRAKALMASLGPTRTGSAAYQRRMQDKRR